MPSKPTPTPKPMTETEKGIRARREQEDQLGVSRTGSRSDSKETSLAKKKLGVKQSGGKWLVYNVDSGKVIYEASSEEGARRKRDTLTKERTPLYKKLWKKVTG